MKVSWCFLLLFATWTVAIEGQPSTQGFVSIDCGATSGTSYQDNTSLWYVSDDLYIDTGTNYNISKTFTSSSKQASTLRSFPNESRNCYTLWNVTKGSKYLLRATFLYGNYDGKQTAQISTPLQFDLHIDVSFWRRVKITDASSEYAYEVVTVAAHDFIWVCLVNINTGTPFISALELRPLKNYLYPYAFLNQSNAVLFRVNYGPSKEVVIRYPDDPYDRMWSSYQYDTTILMNIDTKKDITKYYDVDLFEAPKSVLQTALTPISSPNLTTMSYDIPPNEVDFPGYYVVLHLAELQNLSSNQSRQFDIYLNDRIWFPNAKPAYLKAKYVYETKPEQSSHNVLTLVQSNTTQPPILNAMEVYWPVSMEVQQLTSAEDVSAILAVKTEYQIVRNWNGDPCSPTNLSWYGVSCSQYEPPQITSLNFSDFGLSGNISDSFAKLKQIVYLDLSHNNLTGGIPDSLASMSALQVLNLSGNNLNGYVPDILVRRSNAGMLLLLVDSCTNCGGKSKKSLSGVIVAIIVACIAIVLIIAALLSSLMILRRRKKTIIGSEEQNYETQVHHEIKQFTLQELTEITNNFSRTIGRGGFGFVYHGYLENQIEVAVKVCSQQSGQGNKQFLAEVRSLSLVHHKTLVTLVGYCKDGDYLAVVYEYMPRGSLFDHIRGKESTSKPLNWRMRLNILLEAAQALDYLHTGCGIVHRDVKSNNILLGQNFEAKVSDLGLARTFSADTNSSLITICGTPGYIDPEYQRTYKLTEKSDVYSFGVILLEMVTGEPPILNSAENIHITELVKDKLDKRSIEDVIDSKFEGEYDMNSVRKVVDLAMVCTSDKSINRPTMADVVIQLKDSVQMEEHRQKGKLQHSDMFDTNTSVSTSEEHHQKGKLQHSDMSDTNTSASTSVDHCQKGNLQHTDMSDTNTSVSTSEEHRQKGMQHSDTSDTNTSTSHPSISVS